MQGLTDRRGAGLRVRLLLGGLMPIGLCAALVGSCDETERHKVMSFFFDGVGPLAGQEREGEMRDPNLHGRRGIGEEQAWTVHEPYRNCLAKCHGSRLQRTFSREVKLTAPIPDLCYECHEDMVTLAGWVHGPVAAGECTFCHEPHRSPQKFLLKRPIPELCYMCHDVAWIASIENHSDVSYSRCDICHEGHTSPVRRLLRVGPPVETAGLPHRSDLTAEQAEQLFKQARADVQDGKSLVTFLETVTTYVTQREIWKARVYLEGVRNSRPFTDPERRQIDEVLQKLYAAEESEAERQAEEHRKRSQAVAQLYYQSVKSFRAGRYNMAREGFLIVLESDLAPEPIKRAVKTYLVKIDKHLKKE